MAILSILTALLLSFSGCSLAGSLASPVLAPYQSPPVPTLLSPTVSPAVSPSAATKATPSIVTILQKYGYFTALIRLLKTTGMDGQIDAQIKPSNGVTFFAPTDAAFSKLKAGTLNSFTTQQQVELLQFHVVPTFLSTSQFQTVSNPLFTLADGANDGKFPLNISINAGEIDLSTGIDNATITNTLYSRNQLAVYQVDRVLLPRKLFMSNPPPPTPAPVVAEAPAAATATIPKKAEPEPAVATASVRSSASEDSTTRRMVVQGLAIAASTAAALFFL